MTLERPRDESQLDDFIEKAINEYKLSSIREISEIANVSIDRILDVIQELIAEGRIIGRLDIENGRFFNSNVDVPAAQQLRLQPTPE